MTIAVVRIRGSNHLSFELRDTFHKLGLDTKNNLVLIKETPSLLGMINKVKDYTTWGPLAPETEKALESVKKKNKTYFLHPPRKGFERKGTKVAFIKGGALGNRGEKINDLIKRMLPETTTP